MIKRIITITSLIFCLLISGAVFAATHSSSGSVNINAEIKGGVPPPHSTKTLEIVPAGGHVAPNCGQATITWKTIYNITTDGKTTTVDASASTEVGYGETAEDDNVVTGATGINHSVTLTGLTEGKTYKYYVFSSDGTLTKKYSGTFIETCGIGNPTIAVSAQNQGARISVTYPAGDVARLVIRRNIGSAPPSMTDGTGVYDGAPVPMFNDPAINLGVTYWYSVFICNSSGACSEGTFGSAQRLVYNVSGLQANAGDRNVALSWNNPGNDATHDFSFSAARLLKVSGNCAAAGPDDGAVLAEGNISGYNDTNLTNGQTYYYKVFVKNGYSEYSGGVCVSAVPATGAEVRCITGISVLSGNNWASVGWTNPNNIPGVFQFENVQWQRANACVSSIGAGLTAYSGSDQSFYDSNVVNNNIYAYTAFVRYNQGHIINCGCVAAMPKSGQGPSAPTGVPGGPGGGQMIIEQNPNFNFFVNGGVLQIYPNANREINILPGYDLTVNIARDKLLKPVAVMVAQIDNKNYFIALDSGQNKYQTTFNVPLAPGDYELLVSTVYFDQTVSNQFWKLKVLPLGFVSVDIRGVDRLSEVQIMLRDQNGDFNGYGITNPQLSSVNGLFGFMVPNGTYDLVVSKIGYKTYLWRGLKVNNNIINTHINVDLDQSILKTTIDILQNPEKIADNVSAIAREAVLENPQMEKATVAFVAPAAAAAVSISTVAAIPWWSLFHYLQFIFTEPFAWLLRRKRKGWGVVYNSITKKPVDLAVVRLYDNKTKKLLRSHITDKDGRYNFMVDEGEYYLEVTKPSFIFPSIVLANIKEDKKYVDLYHGQIITIREGQAGVIVANIPIDQEAAYVSDRQILSKYFWNRIRKNISISGPIFSAVVFVVYPRWLTVGFVLVHCLMYWLFHRLAEQKKARAWGIVYDRDTKQLLAKAVIRIFSPEYNKMLEVQITDQHGRYGFLAGDNVYYLTANKAGYKEYRSEDIDLRGKRVDEVVGQDIALEKVAAGSSPRLVSDESERGFGDDRRVLTAAEPLRERVENPPPPSLPPPPPPKTPPAETPESPILPQPKTPSAPPPAGQELSSLEEITEQIKNKVDKNQGLPAVESKAEIEPDIKQDKETDSEKGTAPTAQPAKLEAEKLAAAALLEKQQRRQREKLARQEKQQEQARLRRQEKILKKEQKQKERAAKKQAKAQRQATRLQEKENQKAARLAASLAESSRVALAKQARQKIKADLKAERRRKKEMAQAAKVEAKQKLIAARAEKKAQRLKEKELKKTARLKAAALAKENKQQKIENRRQAQAAKKAEQLKARELVKEKKRLEIEKQRQTRETKRAERVKQKEIRTAEKIKAKEQRLEAHKLAQIKKRQKKEARLAQKIVLKAERQKKQTAKYSSPASPAVTAPPILPDTAQTGTPAENVDKPLEKAAAAEITSGQNEDITSAVETLAATSRERQKKTREKEKMMTEVLTEMVAAEKKSADQPTAPANEEIVSPAATQEIPRPENIKPKPEAETAATKYHSFTATSEPPIQAKKKSKSGWSENETLAKKQDEQEFLAELEKRIEEIRARKGLRPPKAANNNQNPSPENNPPPPQPVS